MVVVRIINLFRKAILYVIVNLISCIIVGLIVFSLIGEMSQREDVELNDVATKSPGLILVVFSDAFLQVCISHYNWY